MRIGIDFGGTKIEAAAIGDDGAWLSRERVPTPDNYEDAVRAVAALVARTEETVGRAVSIGMGMPGSISPRTGVMRNANTTYLNGRAFREDLRAALGRDLHMQNDANCLALSEAHDGAAAGMRVTYAVILGTGCGGGLVVDGRIVEGANGIAAEIGHIPLPWPRGEEVPGPRCWCGLDGCLEKWVSGTGFQDDYRRRTGLSEKGAAIVEKARAGDQAAVATLDAYVDRLGRALATIANICDPDCFVFGGGMSNVGEIYDRLPDVIERYTFSDGWEAKLAPAKWGDSSGVRGAARLGA